LASSNVKSEKHTAGSAASHSGIRLLARQTKTGTSPPPQLAPHVLVVDDEEVICQQLNRLYSSSGYAVTTATLAEEALEILEGEDIDLVVTDIRLPGLSGVELTQKIREKWPEVPVIVMTGYAEIDTAVEVLKLGASDFIVKPFSIAAIQESSRIVLEKARVFSEIRHIRRYLKDSWDFSGMISKTPEMHRVFEVIRMVSGTDITVVVEGETGTGKELVASAIHHQSPRRDGPFLTINCAGFPESLLESELFGCEKGAFTGADQSRPGKIELANKGTLFLDEIESISLTMQAKLLRVLEDRKVQRLGGTRTINVDMRVIAATNVPLKILADQGQMRSDFYFRINVVRISLIPLRQRLEDIPLLVQDFIRHHSVAKLRGVTGISKNAMSRLMGYHWPGNIRELQNVLERAIALTKSQTIEEVELSENSPPAEANGQPISPGLPLHQWVREQEKAYLAHKLKTFGGRMDITAKSCGVDVRTIHRKMRLYGLHKKVFQNTREPAGQRQSGSPPQKNSPRPQPD
jgi:DNA-binding NtrC family response regulator